MRLAARRIAFTLLAGAGFAAIAGCSTYGGEKLGTGPATGIPYALPRPEFALTRTPPAEGQSAPSYTLAVSYQPDPTQIYTIRINPAIFTDPEFTVKLGAGGTMTGTKAGFTEQITPTIAAIGSFTANLVGALGKGVFDADSVRKQIEDVIKRSAEKTGAKCAADSTVSRYASRKPEKKPGEDKAKELKVAEELSARLKEFKDDATFADRFHYVNGDELSCLKDALDLLNATPKATREKSVESFRDARAKHVKDFPDDRLFAERLDRAVATDDSSAFTAMRAEVNADKASTAEATKNRGAARDKVFAAAVEAARSTVALNAAQSLAAIVNLDPAAWRARHVLYLERAIDASTLAAIQQPARAAEFGKDIDILRVERAAAIGVPELYARVKVLEDFLARIPERVDDRGGKGSRTAEFATARAELDEALKQIDARRSRVLADAKPPTPPAVTPLGPVRVIVVDPSYLDSHQGKDSETYVIVLKEVE